MFFMKYSKVYNMDNEGVKARFNEFYAGAKEAARQRSLQNVQINTRSELSALINRLEFLSGEEKALLVATLKFSNRKLVNEMTPADSISFVRDKVKLTPKVLDQLYATGQKLFPVVHNDLDDCLGVVYLDEISEVARGEQTLNDVAHPKPPIATVDANLNDVMKLLLDRGHQVALVSRGNHIIGMIELSKILNLLLGK